MSLAILKRLYAAPNEVGRHLGLGLAQVTSLGKVAHGFGPAENLLNPLPDPLADAITFMPGGPGVYAGAPLATGVTGHMGRHF